MSSEKMWIRNAWDREIAHSVLVLDEYRLNALANSGKDVRWALDVGAHIGAFTRLVKQLWPASNVIAVEPDPQAAPYWHLNTGPTQGLYWHPQAIVPVGGPTRVRLMSAADHNPAANFVAEVVSQFTPIPTDRETNDVVAGDVLQLLARYRNPQLDLVKLDCEGAEADILDDLHAANYLPRIGHIVGEWHYFESIPRIERALAATHELTVFRHDFPWGAFFAKPRS
jgi:FkbM family methyltransferase